MVEVELIEQVGMVGTAKRMFGKILNKENWGYREKNISRTFTDREALKEDLSDYHAIYSLRLNNYIKSWRLYWINSVAMILNTIAQKKDDLVSIPAEADPEKYRLFLSKVRAIKEWFDEMDKNLFQRPKHPSNSQKKKRWYNPLKIQKHARTIFTITASITFLKLYEKNTSFHKCSPKNNRQPSSYCLNIYTFYTRNQ